jgi:hypothetical protein
VLKNVLCKNSTVSYTFNDVNDKEKTVKYVISFAIQYYLSYDELKSKFKKKINGNITEINNSLSVYFGIGFIPYKLLYYFYAI